MGPVTENHIAWTKDKISPGELHVYLNKALDDILTGKGFLPDSKIPNSTVKKYLQRAVLFDDKGSQDALVANLRNAVFNYLNMDGGG